MQCDLRISNFSLDTASHFYLPLLTVLQFGLKIFMFDTSYVTFVLYDYLLKSSKYYCRVSSKLFIKGINKCVCILYEWVDTVVVQKYIFYKTFMIEYEPQKTLFDTCWSKNQVKQTFSISYFLNGMI